MVKDLFPLHGLFVALAYMHADHIDILHFLILLDMTPVFAIFCRWLNDMCPNCICYLILNASSDIPSSSLVCCAIGMSHCCDEVGFFC